MIVNKTRKTILAKEIQTRKGLGKIFGLMGKEKPETIIFKTRFGIHTFFLKFPIDVSVLDKKNKVVFLKKGVKPNRVLIWNIKFDRVIELPAGALEKSKTKKGDFIKFNL